MEKIDLTQKQAEQLQRDVDYHMELCYEYLNYIEDDRSEIPEIFNEVEMFCGCEVCITREHLMATFNSLRNMDIIDIAVE